MLTSLSKHYDFNSKHGKISFTDTFIFHLRLSDVLFNIVGLGHAISLLRLCYTTVAVDIVTVAVLPSTHTHCQSNIDIFLGRRWNSWACQMMIALETTRKQCWYSTAVGHWSVKWLSAWVFHSTHFFVITILMIVRSRKLTLDIVHEIGRLTLIEFILSSKFGSVSGGEAIRMRTLQTRCSECCIKNMSVFSFLSEDQQYQRRESEIVYEVTTPTNSFRSVSWH